MCTKIGLFFTLLIFGFGAAKAQDFSNKGRDFWVGYGYHQAMNAGSGGTQQMVLYFATEGVTTITITVPSVGYTQTLTSAAAPTVLTSAPIPKFGAQDLRLNTENALPLDRGIHIVASAPIVAYAHIYNASVSGATILFPTPTLGKEYYSINYTNQSNVSNSNAFFYVIAADTGTTTVEIIPSAATLTRPAGVPFSVTMTQGQTYNVMGQTTGNSGVDLTGSRIRSLPTASGSCKRIAVFSGSGRIAIDCSGGAPSSDNYMVQSFPQSAWGRKFLTTATVSTVFGNPVNNNIYRICVSNPAAVVTVNGAPIAVPLQGGFYYQLAQTSVPQRIESNLPVTVAQYIPSEGRCGTTGQGDPETFYLSPVEQNINRVLWNATPNNLITSHFFNVIIPNTGSAISSFTLDGVPVSPALFTVHPQDPNFSYLSSTVTGNTFHTIQSDSGFNAIAYGFGMFESYGYNAGTNIRDLSQQISTATQFGIDIAPSVCTGTPFKFKLSLPYQPDSLQLNFLGATNLPGPPFTNTSLSTPIPDSIRIVNGRTIYWYSFPIFYTFNNIGTYPIRITAFAPASLGSCGSIQDIDFNLEVSNPPVVDFSSTTPRCAAETVQFTDNTTSVKPTYLWYWNFDDPTTGANNTSNLKNPTHLFSGPGTYDVRFSAITTAGCVGDTITRQVIVAPLPSGTITGTANVCVNGTQPVITFTGTGGSAPYTFTYNINGGTAQTVTTTGMLTTATVNAPTAVAGPFVYNLVNVQNTGSTLCTAAVTGQSATIRVNPLPTATITGSTTVCQNSASPTITFTGANATAPYTFTYNVNGGANQTVTTTVGNSVTIAAPTGSFGTFVYNLVSVSESSITTCSNNVTGQTATVNVSPLPMVTITGTTAVCRNATAPLVTFTGSNGTAPYTFTYNINGGANQTVTTTAGNSTVTVAASTATAGPFTYTVTSVTDGSPQACANNGLNQFITITVNPLPTAVVSTNLTTVCVNAVSPIVTFTGAAGTAPYTFNYNLNGAPQTAIISTGNTATITVPTTGAGTFNYQLTSVTDASSTLCAQPQTGQVTIVVQDLPTAAIGSNSAVCQNAPNPLITFTGAGGTRPYIFTYSINGGATQTIATTAASNTVTVAAPTAATGTFTYSLLSVRETSGNNCSQAFPTPATAVITVNPLPTATITGGTNVCLNATSPTVTFTGAAGTAPYTFSYTINGAAQPVLVSTGNSVTLSVPTNAAGTFNYQLVSVQDASSTTCSLAQTGSTSFIVYPAPVAIITSSVPLCDSLLVSFNSATSTAGAGTITGYAWNFGDPTSGAANTATISNPTHTFSAAGTYNVTLTITTSNNCVSQVAAATIVINPKPKAGFVLPEVCLLDPFAQFTDTSSVAAPSTITGWLWNFGDPASGPANTSTVQNATHTYSAVGNYNVELISITNSGCRDTIRQVLTVNGGNPISNFAQQSPGMNCANDSVGIINQSTIASGSITKIEIYWDVTGAPTVFDVDDFPTSGKIYRHKYPDFQAPLTRTFNVRMRAFSGGVCFSDRIVPVTVNASPRVQFNAIPNACYVQAPFQITQASEIGGVPGTGVFSGPGVSATGIFNPTGQPIGVPLTIKYVFTSSAAGCKDSASQTITILDTAQARFTIVTPSCERSVVTFTDQSIASAGTTISSTTWNFGDGSADQTFVTGGTITHTYALFGAYNVTMYATNSEGCRSTSTTRVANVTPIPRASFVFDKTDYCLPNALVAFNSSSSTIADGTQASFTYAWDFGDPSSGSLNTSTAVNPTHIYRVAGIYPVRLTITSGAGCSKDTVINLDRLHPQPFADFTIAKRDLCVDQSVVLMDVSTGADGVLTNWDWSFGEVGATSSLQNPPAYMYSGPGSYNVKLTVTNNFGCIKDTTKVVNVFDYPVVDAGENRFVLEGGSVTLTPTVTAVAPQYNWTWNVPAPNGYLNNNLIRNPVSSPLTDVTYRLTVTGSGDCASSDTVFIKLLLAPRIPNTFSPNNDGINDTWVIKYLDTYPKAKVKIFTRTGELVFQTIGYTRPWNGTKNGKSLPIDTYYYVIEPENGRAPITGYVTILK